jgi:hypothetical protein
VVVSRNRAALLRRRWGELRYTLPGQKIDGTQL